MPTSAGDLINQVRAAMDANGTSSDPFTTLVSPIGAADTSFSVVVSGPLTVSEGVIEVGSELMFASNVDTNTGTVTVADYVGRGFDSTTAVSHTAGEKVTSSPRVPRRDILRALNDSLSDLFPRLYRVVVADITGDGTDTYDLPVDTAYVKSLHRMGDGVWAKVSTYRVSQAQTPGDPAQLTLPWSPATGDLLRVAVALPPVPFANEAVLVSSHGIPVEVSSALTTAALLKLVPGSELDRLQTQRVEQSDRSRVVPASAGLTASRYLQLVYEGQVAAAAAALSARYPKQIVRRF